MPRPRLLLALTAVLLAATACGSRAATTASSDPTPTPRPTPSPTPTASVPVPPPDVPHFGERRPGRPWRTSGYTPMPVERRPYAEELLTADILPARVDEDGIPVFEIEGRRYYHPVASIQYALAKLDVANRTQSADALRAAVSNAERLLAVAIPHDGGLFFTYRHDFPLGGVESRTIHAPWWSAMAQGEAVSLFVRLYQATGQEKWRDAADQAFATLDDRGPVEGPWTVYVDPNGYLWFEEFAGDTQPLLVLNGDMFAIFGLWDYYSLTHSARAKELFDAAVTTLREHLPRYRKPGDVSYYCLLAPFCQQELWQNEKYHGIVTEQMRIIADMTDDPWFTEQADRFAEDFVPEPVEQ